MGLHNEWHARNALYVQMHEEHEAGTPIEDLAAQHGFHPTSVKAGFHRRGWTYRTKRSPGASAPAFLPLVDDTYLRERLASWECLDSKAKGTIAEGYVRNRLLELGFDVWSPNISNHVADVGVRVGNRLIMIQVKAASYDRPSRRFRCALVRRDVVTRKHVAYAEGDFDFFIVFCAGLPTQEYYVIPAAIGIEHTSANLIPHRDRIIRSRPGVFTWEQYRNSFDLLREIACGP